MSGSPVRPARAIASVLFPEPARPVTTMRRPSAGRASAIRSEQARLGPLDAAEVVVVHLDADDAPLLGQPAGLGLDHLGDEHPPDRAEVGVPVHELEVPGQLLDAVDLAT